jgi:hypothetical protein
MFLIRIGNFYLVCIGHDGPIWDSRLPWPAAIASLLQMPSLQPRVSLRSRALACNSHGTNSPASTCTAA